MGNASACLSRDGTSLNILAMKLAFPEETILCCKLGS